MDLSSSDDRGCLFVAGGPDLVEIYLPGAKSERLLAYVFCGRRSDVDASERHRAQKVLLDVPINSVLHYFLAERCDEDFCALSSRRAQRFGSSPAYSDG